MNWIYNTNDDNTDILSEQHYREYNRDTFYTNLLCCQKFEFGLYRTIANKGLAALTLLEGNFFDSAYPICRGITELYLKLLTLLHNPNASRAL